MTKFLLLVALLGVVWWLWRNTRQPRPGARPERGAPREAERMVRCARCGVNQPVSESILADGLYYCSAAHLREARSDEH